MTLTGQMSVALITCALVTLLAVKQNSVYS